MEEPERKHPAVFFLENTLRTAARLRARAVGKRKRRASVSSIDFVGKAAGQRLLRVGRDARTETRSQTNQNSKCREGPPPDLRTWRHRRCVHRARSGFAARRTGERAKRGRAIAPQRSLKSPSPSSSRGRDLPICRFAR